MEGSHGTGCLLKCLFGNPTRQGTLLGISSYLDLAVCSLIRGRQCCLIPTRTDHCSVTSGSVGPRHLYLCIMSCHGTRGLLKWQPGNPDTCAECYWGSLLWVVATWYGRILKSTPVSNPPNIIIFSYKIIYNMTLKRFQASCNVWISTHQLHLDSRSWHWWKYLDGFSFYILLFGFYNVKFTFSLAFSFFNWYTTSAKIE